MEWNDSDDDEDDDGDDKDNVDDNVGDIEGTWPPWLLPSFGPNAVSAAVEVVAVVAVVWSRSGWR